MLIEANLEFIIIHDHVKINVKFEIWLYYVIHLFAFTCSWNDLILNLRGLSLVCCQFLFCFIHLHWFCFNTDRGRDTYFNSAKLSFMSVIFDEDVLLVKDPLREYPSTAALQT